MKKLTIIILIIGTILLSGCGANQKQVSSENKSLSGEKVAVSSGEKVKNSMKKKNIDVSKCKDDKKITKDKFFEYIKNNNIACVEKYIKQGGDINKTIAGDWKTSLMHASEKGYKDIVKLLLDNKADLTIKYKGWKTALIFAIAGGYKDIVKLYLKNGEDPDLQYKTGIDGLIKYANKIGQDDIANILKKYEIYIEKNGITVDYKIQELTDYNHCLISKEDFENMQKAVRKLFTGDNNDNIILSLKYKTLCLPKYKLIGTIKRGDPDTITVESCHDGKPYTLKNFKKGDKKFEYNIAYGYGNVCTEDNISYEFNFYKNGKKLNEINPKKPLFDPDKGNIIYKQGDEVCKIGESKCWEVENNKIKSIDNISIDEMPEITSTILKGKYKGYKYINIFGGGLVDNDGWDYYYSYIYFPENKDLFLYSNDNHEGINNSFFSYFNFENNSNYKKYIEDKDIKYLKKDGYLCFLGPKDSINYDSISKLDDGKGMNSFGDEVYIAGDFYTGYVDDKGFTKVFCSNKSNETNKDINFGTSVPIFYLGHVGILSTMDISVGENLLKKLGIDTTKSEQDITYFKNLDDILENLYISRIYESCIYGFYDKKKKERCLSKTFPPVYKYLSKDDHLHLKLDKSKIKKIILKLKPEHYPFGEERYLYEVWINGKGI